MGFIDEVEEHFKTRCLFTALGVTKDANESELKKAYRLLSLKFHPDRSTNENKESNKCIFQTLSKIHVILANTEQRAVYDETGELLDDSDICSQNRDWESYWRILFKKVTKQDIEKFEKEFKGTEKESEELMKYYLEYEGDMEQILTSVLCSTEEDVDRFRVIIQTAIDCGELPAFDAFINEDSKKKKKRKAKVKTNIFVLIYRWQGELSKTGF